LGEGLLDQHDQLVPHRKARLPSTNDEHVQFKLGLRHALFYDSLLLFTPFEGCLPSGLLAPNRGSAISEKRRRYAPGCQTVVNPAARKR
jgi:hypothetical protein